MIIDLNKMLKEQQEFNLGEAIRNDKVDIIFCGTSDFDEIIEESHEISDGKMAILIRNKKEDKISHNFTMKFIPKEKERRTNPDFRHDGHYGLPISFTKNNKEWYVNIGPSKKKEAEKIKKSLNKQEKMFITAIVNNIGDDIIDYWNVEDTDTNKGYKELENIVDRILDKYYGK